MTEISNTDELIMTTEKDEEEVIKKLEEVEVGTYEFTVNLSLEQ